MEAEDTHVHCIKAPVSGTATAQQMKTSIY